MKNNFNKFHIAGKLFLNDLSNMVLLGTSKAGNISWKAMHQGNWIKIYSCFCNEQANLIKWVSNESAISKYFPYCYGIVDNIVICEWIEGTEYQNDKLNSALLKTILDFTHHIHQLEVPFHVKGNFYTDNCLLARFLKYSGILDYSDFLSGINPVDRHKRLAHPDITFRNLIFQEDGTFKIIDNELFSLEEMYLLDIFNFGHSLGNGQLIKEILEHYPFLEEYSQKKDLYDKWWIIRLAATALQNGSIEKADNLIQTFRNGTYINPFGL